MTTTSPMIRLSRAGALALLVLVLGACQSASEPQVPQAWQTPAPEKAFNTPLKDSPDAEDRALSQLHAAEHDAARQAAQDASGEVWRLERERIEAERVAAEEAARVAAQELEAAHAAAQTATDRAVQPAPRRAAAPSSGTQAGGGAVGAPAPGAAPAAPPRPEPVGLPPSGSTVTLSNKSCAIVNNAYALTYTLSFANGYTQTMTSHGNGWPWIGELSSGDKWYYADVHFDCPDPTW